MTRSTTPPGRPSANLSPARLRAAIPLLQARIKDLEDLAVDRIDARSHPTVLALESKIGGTLAHVFGAETTEYHRLREAKSLDTTVYLAALQLGAAFRPGHSTGGPPVHEIQSGVDRGRKRAIGLLGAEVLLMKEQLGDSADAPGDRAIRAYQSLDLHPEIARAATELYEDGHYANAIEDAVKALNGLVRIRSGKELDGADLMKTVFSPKNPVLRFNDLTDRPDQDEQEGFMMMFSGAVAGLRNPRAHKLIKDDPERALEFIAFVSLLAKLLNGAKKAHG